MATIFTREDNSENTSTTLKHFFSRTKWANFNQRGMTTNGEIGPFGDQIYEIWNHTIFVI